MKRLSPRYSITSRSSVIVAAIVLLIIIIGIVTSVASAFVLSSPIDGEQSSSSLSSSSISPASIDDEYCCCSSDELAANSAPLLHVLDELVTKPFFRYFRVNVKKKCPYWVVHLLCTQKGNPCKFCRCDAKDIPVSLQTESDMGNALDEKWGNEDNDQEEEEHSHRNNDYKNLQAGKAEEEVVIKDQQRREQDETATSSLDLKADHSSTIGKFDVEQQKEACPSAQQQQSSSQSSSASSASSSATTKSHPPQQQQQQQQYPSKSKKCTRDEPADPKAEYVDLVRNPEGNTFYLGEKASRVWRAIYEENCFNLAISNNNNYNNGNNPAAENHETAVVTGQQQQQQHQCREQLAFYRLISGLHTSISTHIAAYYHFPIMPGDPRYKPTTSAEDEELHRLAKMTPEEKHMSRAYAKPNCQVFDERLTQKPQHVANMHFLYRFVIRALTRSRNAFIDPETNKMRDALRIGDDVEDAATELLVERLFHQHLLCSPTFNESKLLQEPNAVAMLPEMKRMIRNMTTILDCISCEKCRLWGKLQLLGLATAFKIVMNPADKVPHLERKELMSLVNLARQVADSVHNVNVLCKRAPQCARNQKKVEGEGDEDEAGKKKRNEDL